MKHSLTLDNLTETVHVFPPHNKAIRLAALSFFEGVDTVGWCAL